MPGADIATVTENGLQDMHAVMKGKPVVDCHQGGWGLAMMSVVGGWTKIRLTKPVKAEDTTQDRDVPSGPVLIIMAFGPDRTISYHQSNRKIATHTFYNGNVVIPETVEADFAVDILMRNYTVPSQTTTYACASFDVEGALGAAKYHAIKFHPVIREGRGYNVHHILMFGCAELQPTFEKYIDVGAEGDGCRMGFECRRYLLWGWAAGGHDMTLPSNAGIPFGPNTKNTKIIMEFHYDNPLQTSGAVDDSGVTVSFTKTLRPDEAGFYNIGDPFVQTKTPIPPLKDFTIKFDCGTPCTSKMTGPVTVLGTWIHMHTIGIRGALQQYRNGELAQTLASVDYWDNSMQRFVPVEQGLMTIHPNDTLRTVCNYYDPTTVAVNFGPATTDEMCMGFLLVYPLSNVPGTVCGPLGTSSMCGPMFVEGTAAVSDDTPLPPRWGECTNTIYDPASPGDGVAAAQWSSSISLIAMLLAVAL
eukprot:TRINITY_DN6410_c5_g1_i1.p1 TRINITY_DN6410_c5_g1~~TRINITY_DN6410_c5_g1_i1.p1  ORF type:complete len:549 (+),score=45.23 TRINITY_DN6410_c5_g1_i1:231-1649(+)